MKTIAYYISDYGYGHASRSIAVIRELLERKPSIRIIVCTSFPMNFLKESLTSYSNVQYRVVVNDIGYFLKNNSLEPDIVKLTQEYDQYINSFSEQISNETDFLLKENVDFIISDIAPIPFLCADKLDIPSIGISNFSWYTAYKSLISEEKLLYLKEAYGKIDHFIALAGANEPQWGRITNRTFEFISRQVDLDEVNRIRRDINPDPSKMFVYVGFGMRVNVDILSSWEIWNNNYASFIVSSSHHFKHPNVSVIPSDYVESQNYIAVSDLVISKAGWGTVSEAVSSGKPLLILNRSGMQEDANTIQYLQNKNLCRLLEWDDISNLSLEPGAQQKKSWKFIQNTSSLNHKDEIISSIFQIIENNNGRRKETI